MPSHPGKARTLQERNVHRCAIVTLTKFMWNTSFLCIFYNVWNELDKYRRPSVNSQMYSEISS